MTVPAPTELLKLAEWLCHEQARFASSIACNDPAIKAHIATLKAWEEAVRQAASVERATYTEVCKNDKCPRGGLPVEIVRPVLVPDPNSASGQRVEYKRALIPPVERAEVAGEADGSREALTRRILEAWQIRFPNNAYAWPGAPNGFASAAAKVVAAFLASPPRSEGVRASEPDWKQDQAETSRIRPRPQSEVRTGDAREAIALLFSDEIRRRAGCIGTTPVRALDTVSQNGAYRFADVVLAALIVAQAQTGFDDTDHVDWDAMAEKRLGQSPVEHGRRIPQTSPAPGCDSGSLSAQAQPKCTHPNKFGSGTCSADGSGSLDWHCQACGASGHDKWGPKVPSADREGGK